LIQIFLFRGAKSFEIRISAFETISLSCGVISRGDIQVDNLQSKKLIDFDYYYYYSTRFCGSRKSHTSKTVNPHRRTLISSFQTTFDDFQSMQKAKDSFRKLNRNLHSHNHTKNKKVSKNYLISRALI